MANNSQQTEVQRAREMMQEALLEEMEAALDWDIKMVAKVEHRKRDGSTETQEVK